MRRSRIEAGRASGGSHGGEDVIIDYLLRTGVREVVHGDVNVVTSMDTAVLEESK